MTKLIINKYILLFLAFSMLTNRLVAQDAGKQVVKLHYYNTNNNVQYLLVESMLKKGKVFTPQKNKEYELYLDATNLVGKMKTDESGKAKLFLPASLKTVWDAAPQHTFSVKAGEDEVVSDFAITKAKISLDTVNTDGVRSITASVMKYEGDKWIPAKDVEMKIGVQRLDGSILSAGDEATYTTDSSGTVTAEFKKIKLSGDEKGNITLAAKAEDNEFFGNLLVEKKAVWGIPTKVDNNFFNQRTLWSTRFKTPYWLLLIAYSIIIGVWGTLIYLIRQVIKIKKLGA